MRRSRNAPCFGGVSPHSRSQNRQTGAMFLYRPPHHFTVASRWQMTHVNFSSLLTSRPLPKCLRHHFLTLFSDRLNRTVRPDSLLFGFNVARHFRPYFVQLANAHPCANGEDDVIKARHGISSHVLPSSNRPAAFLPTFMLGGGHCPSGVVYRSASASHWPHCLK